MERIPAPAVVLVTGALVSRNRIVPDPLAIIRMITDGTAPSRHAARLLSEVLYRDELLPQQKSKRVVMFSQYEGAALLGVDEATSRSGTRWLVTRGFVQAEAKPTPSRQAAKMYRWRLTRKGRSVGRRVPRIPDRYCDDLDIWLGSLRRYIVDAAQQGEVSIASLAADLKLSWPAVVKQVNILAGDRILSERPRTLPRTGNPGYGHWDYDAPLRLARFDRWDKAVELGVSGETRRHLDVRDVRFADHLAWLKARGQGNDADKAQGADSAQSD
jgi:hypothetical protein